jgi:hypothetical protein
MAGRAANPASGDLVALRWAIPSGGGNIELGRRSWGTIVVASGHSPMNLDALS